MTLISIKPNEANGELYDVCDEDGPIVGFIAKPLPVAQFLRTWLEESLVLCEKKAAEKLANEN